MKAITAKQVGLMVIALLKFTYGYRIRGWLGLGERQADIIG